MKKNKLIVNQVNIVSANRQRKDIGTFRTSLSAAESIHFPNRSLLYDIYSDILIDGHLYGCLSKRTDNVLNKSIHFNDKEGRRVKEMDNIIESMTFRNIIELICLSIYWGVSGLEFIPGKDIVFEEIPRKHIKPEKKIVVIDQNDNEGISYEELPNIWVIGSENDKGILLNCAPYIIYKRGAFGDWAQYNELFGQPIRVMYYDAHDTKTKMELRQVLDDSGSSLALLIPKQAKFEMMDGKDSNGDGELFAKFIDSCNRDVSVMVLGNTETTNSSNKSGLAQAEEHAKQQSNKIKSDMKYVLTKLNSERFLSILKSYGLPVDGGRFVFDLETNLQDLRKRLDIDISLDKFVPLGDDYWYNKYKVPKPNNYDELLKKRESEKVYPITEEPNLGDDSHDFLEAFKHYLSGIKKVILNKVNKPLSSTERPFPLAINWQKVHENNRMVIEAIKRKFS